MEKVSDKLLGELKQQRPFHSIQEEGVVALMKTVDYLRRSSQEVLQSYDITLQQYNVLRILRGAGDKGLPVLEIAERMVEHSPGITRLIDRLCKKELVKRERSEEDRRQIQVLLSKKGKKLVNDLDDPMDQTNRALLQNLGEDEIQQLISFLDKIRE